MIRIVDKKLYQWDQGREIAISTDADVVDFARKNDAKAVRVKPVVKDGVLTASIPNSLLQSSQQIVAYLVKGDQTIYGQVLPVIPRQKPADYVETEDDVLSYVALEKRVAELEKNADGNSEETDPTVPDWAKQPEKPTYTADEVGAATESELFAFAIKAETEVADSLNVTDCADYKMLGLKIFGKAVQFSTSGKKSYAAATEYEPYTGGIVSPNPEYPQDIVTADNPTIKFCGKNLYSGGDVSGVLSVTVPIKKIEAGTYWLSADSVSTDTDTPDKAKVAFKQRVGDKTVDIRIISVARGHESKEVLLNDWVNEATFYAADSYIASIDDSFYFSNVQLELGVGETTYNPYQSCNLEVNHMLCAVPVSSNGMYIDADGQQWICDTVDFVAKKYIQRIKKLVLTGAEAWEKNTIYDYHYDLVVADNLFDITINPILSSHYSNKRNTGMYYDTNTDYAVMSVDGSRIRIKDVRYQSDLDGFKAMLTEKHADGNPVVIYYALKSPIETALTEEELEKFKKLQTYYGATHVSNNLDCPMQVQYVADTKLYVDQQISAALESATARVASLEQYVVQT